MGGGQPLIFCPSDQNFVKKFDPKSKIFPSIFEKKSFDKKFHSQGLEAKKK